MDYLTVDIMIWVLFSAVLICVLYAAVMQNTLSGLAKRLIEKNADSEESALGLSDLGYKSKLVMKLAGFFSKGGSRLAGAIGRVDNQTAGQYILKKDLLFKEDFCQTKYYINCDSDEKLENRIKERVTLPKLAVTLVLVAAMAFAAPYVVRFVQNSVFTTESEKSGEKVVGVAQDNKSALEEQQEAARLAAEEKAKEYAEKALKEQAEAEAEAEALKQQLAEQQ